MSALLDALRQEENAALQRENVNHPGTIGDMYEGLTNELLGRATAFAEGIAVATGFITDDHGASSDQLDCMVVRGHGESIPYTTSKRYRIDDVVAVVEVKKNLYASQLKSGYENLASVRRFEPRGPRSSRLFRHAFESIALRPLPETEADWEAMTYAEQMLHVTLADEARYPVRIVFGYNGYTTEAGLRDSFARFLEEVTKAGPARGFGVRSLPTLVTCGGYSLVKGNGMPYFAAIDDAGLWPVLLSTADNPMHILLEVLWTRLVYLGIATDEVFGEDLTLESMARCLDARSVPGGWQYHFSEATEQELGETRRKDRSWEPALVDAEQAAVLLLLGRRGAIPMDDADLQAALVDTGYSVESLASSLRGLRLATGQGGRLVLLTDACHVAFLPDGRIVAADNRAGHLTRWLARQQ